MIRTRFVIILKGLMNINLHRIPEKKNTKYDMAGGVFMSFIHGRSRDNRPSKG